VTRKTKVDGMTLPSGFPLVLAKDDGDMKAVQEAGLSVTYVLGCQPGKKVTDPSVPKVFKCVKNVLGYAIVAVEDDDLDLLEIEEHCWFYLPKIPRKIVRDLDAFFRRIDDKLGTEAIVMLTYDPAKLNTEEPSEGWGVLVPKQTNTAGSCYYDPASVADAKEDGVMIVGSVHSHPGMSAFASHTDVQDQANFDGIHITYGWKGKSKVTEYHVELQMAGGRFNFTPDQAFEPEEEHPVSEDVITGWIEKVDKEQPKGYGYQGNAGGYHPVTTMGGSGGSQPKWPEGIPNYTNAKYTGVIVEMLVGESTCPACRAKLSDFEIKRRRCTDCQAFLSKPMETLEDVVKARWEADKFASPELGDDSYTGIYFWKRWKDDANKYHERVDVIRESGWKSKTNNTNQGSGKA
jgi:hypothetical protein